MKRNRLRPWLPVVIGNESLISSAGGVLPAQTARLSGLEQVLGKGLSRWRRDRSVHHPAKTVLDLAITVALGGDCAAEHRRLDLLPLDDDPATALRAYAAERR